MQKVLVYPSHLCYNTAMTKREYQDRATAHVDQLINGKKKAVIQFGTIFVGKKKKEKSVYPVLFYRGEAHVATAEFDSHAKAINAAFKFENGQ